MSVEDPVLANEVNVCRTLNVLVAARGDGVAKVMYAPSSSAYGDMPELPRREGKTGSNVPICHGETCGRILLQGFNKIYGLKTVALRYFNIYGPRQDPASDYAAVILKFVNRIMEGEAPTIYVDGGQTRDFTFVRDAGAGERACD